MVRYGKILLLATVVGITLLCGCYTPTYTVSDLNLYSLYNPVVTTIHPQFSVFHLNDSISTTAVKIDSRELLFNQANANNKLQAQLSVRYTLYPSFSDRTVLDSGTVQYTLDENYYNNHVTYWFSVKTPLKRLYMLEVQVTDVLKRRSAFGFLRVDRSVGAEYQNYGLYDVSGQIPVVDRYVTATDSLHLWFASNDPDTCFVRFSDDEYRLPLPPFASQRTDSLKITFDSTAILLSPADSTLVAAKRGLYFLQTDTLQQAGLSFINAGNYYPNMRTAEDMLRPLRYITSTEEYNQLWQMPTRKAALDDFWLKAAGNNSKAREVIRVFYTRVHLANRFFTSYTEGWRTDRGMIYIVFGAPNSVYRTDETEKWVYGEDVSFSPVEFVFLHRKNPTCDNDYVLRRSVSYKSTWYSAVDAWRNGQVFSLEK